MPDELVPTKPPFQVVVNTGPKLSGLAARKAQVKAAEHAKNDTVAISPNEMEHRIGIVFDDSVSMNREMIADAHAGCEEFLRSCEKDKTAVAMYPLNAEPLQLCSNLPAVAIMTKKISASGGTPLVSKTTQMLKENNLTRAIVFSDGSPNSYHASDYEKLISFKIPIDTVYIQNSNYGNSAAEGFMSKLAADTGGIYLKFERGKSNFRTAFKYLSPGLRYMLADKSFANKIQGI